jgi:hypothetical protein
MAQQKPNLKAFGKPSGVCTVYPATNSLYISISPLDSYPYAPAIPWFRIELMTVPILTRIKSINAPIAAFTMAVILCSYCFSSIRTARQNAQTQASTGSSLQRPVPSERKDESWVQQALEESRAQNGGKGK